MVEFAWSFFALPVAHEIVDVFSKRYDADLVMRAAEDWYWDFLKRADIAYRSELYRHEILCRREFAEQEGYDSAEDFDDWQQRDYTYWLESQTFREHQVEFYRHDEKLQLLARAINNGQTYRTYNMSELIALKFQAYDDQQKFGVDTEDLGKLFDEYWFNSVITNDDVTVRKLRALPYPDYLKTPHWRRVRGAMLLINRARCQLQACGADEGFWMDESMLNVHHKTYVNRGRERFADLALLCEKCHRLQHSEAS